MQNFSTIKKARPVALLWFLSIFIHHWINKVCKVLHCVNNAHVWIFFHFCKCLRRYLTRKEVAVSSGLCQVLTQSTKCSTGHLTLESLLWYFEGQVKATNSEKSKPEERFKGRKESNVSLWLCLNRHYRILVFRKNCHHEVLQNNTLNPQIWN